MEGQGPKPKGKENQKPELAAVASTLATSSASSSSSALNPDTYVSDLSCAVTEELPTKDLAALLSASGGFASILDSGTSSTF
jgi:hypothetical protein